MSARTDFERAARALRGVFFGQRGRLLTGRNADATAQTVEHHRGALRRKLDHLDAAGEASERDYARFNDLDTRLIMSHACADERLARLGQTWDGRDAVPPRSEPAR